MKIIILGAGISGISSAWYLAKAGHEVSVIDRAAGPALETSYANAGQLSYSYTTPWAAPGIPLKALKWMLRPHSPLIIRPDGSAFQLAWLWQMLGNCTEARYRINKERMMRISTHSRAMFAEFAAELPDFDYEGRQRGTLQLFRSDKEIRGVQKDLAVLRDYGVPYREISAAECLAYEPGINTASLAGALYLPNDASGDCQLFASRLAERCAALGVTFHYNSPIERIDESGGAVSGVVAGGNNHQADAYLCTLGVYSRPLLRRLGLKLPVYPVKGYSLTLPIIDEAHAPQSTVIDETYKVALTRFDQRIRIGGMAELSGYTLKLPPKHRATLELVANDLYPGGGDLAQGEYWSGLRPMTPDSTPIVGKTRLSNLYLNTGHGTLGWTMSLGSAQLVADIISGREPAIRCDDLGLARYG